MAREVAIRPRTEHHKRGHWYSVRLVLMTLAALLVLLPVIGFTYETVMAARDARRYPPPGQLVAVDGHRMHLHCTGDGRPTVVMDAGLGGWSLDWSLVQPEIARFARVCTYDRAGMGWSDPGPAPRDARHAVRELHALLTEVGPGPFVLVGHSNGALRVLLYASEYPNEVAGLVLVDPTPVATDDEGLALLAPDDREELGTLVQAMERGAGDRGLGLFEWMHRLRLFGIPRLLADSFLQQSAYGHLGAEVQPAYLATFNNGSFFSTFIAETEQRQHSIDQVRAMTSVGGIRLTVLTSSTLAAFYGDPLPPRHSGRLIELHQKLLWELQVAMSGMSSSGTIQRVPESGHYIQVDRPDAVIRAVQRVVDSIRGA